MAQPLTLKPMTMADIETAVGWAAHERWNPGAQDAWCFAQTDPEGFWGGWLADRMIASISVVNYDSGFAFPGFYIVDPEFRGKGYGLTLWNAAVKHAGARLIGLDGVTSQQKNYRRSGFDLAYRNIRFGGLARRHTNGNTDLVISPVDCLTPHLEHFDRQAFPSCRPAFLAAWIGPRDHIALQAHQDGELVGYGVIRPCKTGAKIGPLFATDQDTAASLTQALLQHAKGLPDTGEVFLDMPEPSKQAMALAVDLGVSPVFETARMYTDPAPDIALERVFGVSSFELG